MRKGLGLHIGSEARGARAATRAASRLSVLRPRNASSASAPSLQGRDVAISPVWEDAASPTSDSAGVRAARFRDAVFRRGLGLIDVTAAYAALWLVVSVIGGGTVGLRPPALLVAPFIVLVSKVIGLYDRDQNTLRKSTVDEYPGILHLSVFYAVSVWLGEDALLTGHMERAQVFGVAVASFALFTLGRSLSRHVMLALTPPERCIFLGNAADADRVARKLSGSPGVKAEVIGRISLRSSDDALSARTRKLGDVGSLMHLIAEHEVQRAIIAPDSHDQDEILHAIRLLKALGVRVSVLPRLLEVVGSSSTFDEIDGITLLGVRQYGLTKSSESLKRSMDVVGAGIAVLLLAPLLVLIAVAVKLDSPGPVFFRQPRIGRRGQRFEMLKFRSMSRDAERVKEDLRADNEAEGGLFKITNDPRITRAGRFLRPISLDELPQLLNVLMGHMSLVGPRPLVPDEDALIEGWERRRLVLRPGMSGLWQIFGSSRIPIQEMVKIDYLYGANWSAWLDLKILIRTIPYVLRRRGR